jgi:hypothetical protein
LDDRKDIVDIQSLELEGLESEGTFHIDERIADVLRNFDFLAYLHLVVVVHLDFKVRRGNAPCDASNDLIKCLQRSNPDSEVPCQQQYFVNFAEPGIVLGVVIEYFRHAALEATSLKPDYYSRLIPTKMIDLILKMI